MLWPSRGRAVKACVHLENRLPLGSSECPLKMSVKV